LSRCLLKTIESLVEFAHKGGITGLKPLRLLHVDLFIKNTIEKSVINVQLLNGPTLGNSNSEYNSNSHWLDYRRKCFQKIKPLSLMKPLSHEACLVFIDSPIGIFLEPKHPFAANSLSIRWKRN
jgi:hypothetical protein